jgi:Skp family chaperone for outer membrane proteins
MENRRSKDYSMSKRLAFIVLPIIAGSVLSSAFVRQSNVTTASSPVALVSTQRILTESAEGKAGIARLQAFQQKTTADLRTQQQKIEQIHQQMLSANASEKTALQTSEQQQRAELERMTAHAQSDFQAVQRELNSDLMLKVRGILNDLLRDQPNVQVVLSSEAVLVWSRSNLDLTDKVLAKLNEQSTPSAGAGQSH